MGKKKQNRTKASADVPQHSPAKFELSTAVFIGICGIIFFAPYFRGLYFAAELLPVHILSLLLFILWWAVKLHKKDYAFLHTPLDYAVLGFSLIYLLALPVAVNTRGAIAEFLKVFNYFLIYWLTKEFSRHRKYAYIILNVLVLSAVGVALLGLGAAAGTWQVTGGYEAGRIYSTLQYPNSLAAYLTGAFLITISLLQSAAQKNKRFYLAAAFILIVTTFLTYSRGGWLIVPVFALLYIILAPKEKRREAALIAAGLPALGLGLLPVLGKLYLTEQGLLSWLVILGAIGIIFVIEQLFAHKIGTIKPLSVIISLVLLTGVLFAGAYIYSSRILSQPLRLAHAPDEPESVKLLDQQLNLQGDTEYTLTLDLLAEGSDEPPYAWRVVLNGLTKDGGTTVLLNERGKTTESWEAKEFTFTTPGDIRMATLRLLNVFPGTSMEVRNVVLTSPASTQKITFTWHRLLPKTLYNRFFTFTINDRNVQSRFRFTRDAWQIIKDYPILGVGGQGWKSLYHQYQSAAYTSREVHNHFIQVWVETGVFGFLLFISIWGLFLQLFCRLTKENNAESKLVSLGPVLGVLAIVAHSLYDFNLSLGAVSIAVWAVMGTVAGLFGKPAPSAGQKPGPGYAAITASAVLLLFIISLQAGYANWASGTRYLRLNRPDLAGPRLEKAARFDPFDPEIRVTLAQAYEFNGRQKGSSEYIIKAEEQFGRAAALDPYNPRYIQIQGIFLVRSTKFSEGMAALKKAIELQPRFAEHYKTLAFYALRVAEYLLDNNSPAEAKDYLKIALQTGEMFSRYSEDLRPLAYNTGYAHYLAGNYEEATDYFKEALWVKEDAPFANVMLSIIYNKTGNHKLAKQHLERAAALDAAMAQFYDHAVQIKTLR